MKKSRVVAMLLSLGMVCTPISAEANSNIAFMSCSVGDKLDITLSDKDVNWDSSNKDIASIKDGLVYILKEGECDLVNKQTGFKVKLSSSGTSNNSAVMEINYLSDTDVVEEVVYRDKTIDIKTVEVNSTVRVDKNVIPSNFKEVENTELKESNNIKNESNLVNEVEAKAEKDGAYVVNEPTGDNGVVKVVTPKLNIKEFNGSVGQSFDLSVDNIKVENKTFTSSNSDIANVDSNGHVTLVNGGEAVISVNTGSNILECKVVSTIPSVDCSVVELKKGQIGKIVVDNNLANLPVSYQIISGEGVVNQSGDVLVSSNEVIVRVIINNQFVYDKTFIGSTIQEEYWDAMQPFMQKCLGTPYVMGGEIPGVALDCSAYVSYVYSSVGLMSGRLTAQGLYDMTEKVEEPMPGDLVFFKETYDCPDYITHVGIYAGNGEMYHSGEPNQKTSLNTSYWQQHLVGYGTMINSNTPKPIIINSNNIYSQQELELIWAIVGQECSTGYDGALAVISCAMNRATINYGGFGEDVLSQLTAPSQFCYSPDVSAPELWQSRLNGNVADFVKQAVNDCLYSGVRNHCYLNFRSGQTPGSVCIGDNWYF